MHRRCCLRCEVNGRRAHAARGGGGGSTQGPQSNPFSVVHAGVSLSQSLGSSLGTLIVTIVHCSNSTNVKLGSEARTACACLLALACCLLRATPGLLLGTRIAAAGAWPPISGIVLSWPVMDVQNTAHAFKRACSLHLAPILIL